MQLATLRPKDHVNPRYDPNENSKIDHADLENILPNQHINNITDIPNRSYRNLGDLPLGRFNDIATQIGELNNKNTMALWNYDDGFYDVFVDTSRISAQTNTVVSAGASRLLQKIFVDDVETGSSELNWEGNASCSIDDTAKVNGTYSIDCVAANEYIDIAESLASDVTENFSIVISVVIGADTGNTADYARILLRNATPADIGVVEFADSGGAVTETTSGTQLLASWAAGTQYNITITPDFANDTMDIDINGTTTTGIPFANASAAFHRWEILNFTSNSAATRHVYFDDYTYKQGYPGSGTITHITKSLGFIPAKAVVSDSVTLNGQNANYTIKDGSGNSVNISRADLDTEIDLSTFADGNITLIDNLSGDTIATPELNYVGVIFV